MDILRENKILAIVSLLVVAYYLLFVHQFTWTETRDAQIVAPSNEPRFGDTSTTNSAGTASQSTLGACADNMTWALTSTDLSADDTSYVSYSGSQWDSGNVTDILIATNFGFSLSADSIDGIVVDNLSWMTAQTGTYHTVQLTTDAGTSLVGTNQAGGESINATEGAGYTTWGTVSSTWGATLADTDVNSTSFGVAFCFTAGANNATMENDHVRMTITYTASVASEVIRQSEFWF